MIEVNGFEVVIPPGLIEGMSEGAIQNVLSDIADAARAHWIHLASGGLRSTFQTYVDGLQPVEMRAGVATIALVGVMPNLLEQGMDERDLHETLLGPNAPVAPIGGRGKHPKADGTGFYRAIPFRHETPGGKGIVAPPMGSAYEKTLGDAAKKLGQDIYKKAKRLAPTTSDPYGKVSYGGRLPAGLAPKLKEHHAVDIYAGMIKQKKTYEKRSQNSYFTFRTISTNSNGWIRAASPGRHYAEQVQAFVQKVAPEAFAKYVESL